MWTEGTGPVSTIGQLKLRALTRLKLVSQENPGLGIIPHPMQETLYRELLKQGLCNVRARAWQVGHIGSLDDPSDRRSYYYDSE